MMATSGKCRNLEGYKGGDRIQCISQLSFIVNELYSFVPEKSDLRKKFQSPIGGVGASSERATDDNTYDNKLGKG